MLKRSLPAAILVFVVVLAVPTWAAAFDPGLEATNFSKIEERNQYEVLTPGFQTLMAQQNARDAVEFPTLLANDPERNPLGNICAQRKNECAGDVRFYSWAQPDGYGIKTPVLFTARSGAVISGTVWATRSGPAQRPGVVITPGSVQAPETLYWGIAATLAKKGYVVLTYDVQGQGRSDTFGETPDQQEGVPSQAGQPFFDGSEDALDFLLSTPANPYEPRPSCGNANGGVGTDHRAKQNRRVADGLNTAFNPLSSLLDPTRIGVAGHSLGAGAVSYTGQTDSRVDAVIAWDNLGTGGTASACPSAPATRTTPAAISKPSLGFSNDYGISQNPYLTDPDPQSKNAAFAAFKTAGIPSMQVNIRGGTHFEYSFIPGQTVNQPLGNATLRGMHMAIWYTAAWLDKYVKGDSTADARLLTDRWRDDALGEAVDRTPAANGGPDGNLFSFYFRSRFDFRKTDNTQVTCDDMRAGCGSMAPDGGPANYSYLAEAMTPDGSFSQTPPDTDGDGTPDPFDSCPTVAGPSSNGGCPLRQPAATGPGSSPGQAACATPLTGTRRSDRLIGTSAGDRITGRRGNDHLAGLEGDDCLAGRRGRDTVNGGPGNDRLSGGADRDRLVGGAGSDTVFGGRRGDRIDVRDGERDTVLCGAGVDRVRADGSDRLRGCERVR